MINKLIDEPYWNELDQEIDRLVDLFPYMDNLKLNTRDHPTLVLDSTVRLHLSLAQFGLTNNSKVLVYERNILSFLSRHSKKEYKELIRDNLTEFHKIAASFINQGFYITDNRDENNPLRPPNHRNGSLIRLPYGFAEEKPMVTAYIREEKNVQEILNHLGLEILLNTEAFSDD